jgi:methylated-DNA-[protein]-cysteine S-methyltransferase
MTHSTGLRLATPGTSDFKRMNKIGTFRSFHYLFDTPFGPVALLWSVCRGQPKIRRVLLSKSEVSAKLAVKTSFPDSISSSCAEIDAVANKILAFLSGDDIHFSLCIICLHLCSRFQQEVLRAEHGIPRGSVSTYQKIAKHLGNVNGARAAGGALANNPFPIIIPCHRAIRSDGTLGGYQGGLEMKRTLLKMEGVFFNALGHVLTDKFFY